MNDAVFISDLHLGPNTPEIEQKFIRFCDEIGQFAKALYILGDFVHAWPGDDYSPSWVKRLQRLLQNLHAKGVELYFMPGNRDFLMGKAFCDTVGMHYLPDPSIVDFNGSPVLLSHGDRYCTDDRSHQLFRRVTRNQFFPKLFLLLPLAYRMKMVAQVRKISKTNKQKEKPDLGYVVESAVIRDLTRFSSDTLIHGHTHAPARHAMVRQGKTCHRFVLSDWDDTVSCLCYNKTKGFKLILF